MSLWSEISFFKFVSIEYNKLFGYHAIFEYERNAPIMGRVRIALDTNFSPEENLVVWVNNLNSGGLVRMENSGGVNVWKVDWEEFARNIYSINSRDHQRLLAECGILIDNKENPDAPAYQVRYKSTLEPYTPVPEIKGIPLLFNRESDAQEFLEARSKFFPDEGRMFELTVVDMNKKEEE